MYLKSCLALAAVVSLSACGSPPAAEQTTAEPTAAATVAAGGKPTAFAQCAACHAVEAGKHGVGPSLAGVYGTKSGELAGYAFSDAMKGAALTWDDKTLDEFLTNPMKKVPGTKMTFAGLSNEADRKAVIEYLKTLK